MWPQVGTAGLLLAMAWILSARAGPCNEGTAWITANNIRADCRRSVIQINPVRVCEHGPVKCTLMQLTSLIYILLHFQLQSVMSWVTLMFCCMVLYLKAVTVWLLMQWHFEIFILLKYLLMNICCCCCKHKCAIFRISNLQLKVFLWWQ